jgi:hypothetical protein
MPIIFNPNNANIRPTLQDVGHTITKIPDFILLKLANKEILELKEEISKLKSIIEQLSSYTTEQIED